MATDASIPLGINPNPLNPEVITALLQKAQQQKQQNALKQILSNPANIDPTTGLPTAQAIQQVSKVDPTAGMKMLSETTELKQRLQEGKQKELAQYQPYIDEQKDALANILGPRVAKDGLEKAVSDSRSDYAEALRELKASGVPDAVIAQMPKELTPALAQHLVAGSVSPKDKAAQAEKEKADKLAQDRLAETEKKDTASAALAAKREADAAAAASKKGFDIYTDKDGNALRINKDSGEVVPVDAKGIKKVGPGGQGASIDMADPGDKSFVEGIANYKIAPPTSGRNQDYRKAVIEAAQKINPDYNEGKYAESVKAQRDFGTGKQGDIARSLNVSVSHLQSLRDLGDALDNGDIKLINAAKQRFAEEFDVPAPTNFDAAKSIVADEVAKGVIGGASAQSDRETLAASLRKSGSPKVINGAIDTFQGLLGGQLGGLRDQYKRTTGSSDFDDTFLSEATRKALGSKEKGGKSADTADHSKMTDAELKKMLGIP